MQNTKHLPSELIHLIIGSYLYDDQLSQRACSLISKTFCACARFYLFERLQLRPWERKWNPDLRNLTLTTFLPIAPYVKHIVIDWDDGETSYPGDNGVTFDILPVISTHRGQATLVSLLSITHSSLQLHYMPRENDPSSCIPTLLGASGSSFLKALHFEYCTLPSIGVLACAMASCTTLETLTIHTLGWSSLDASLRDPPCKLPYQLRVFGFYGRIDTHSALLLTWIASQDNLPDIDPLSLQFYSTEVNEASLSITSFGKSLKSLHLDFSLHPGCFGKPN
jgi:hypothetical protein